MWPSRGSSPKSRPRLGGIDILINNAGVIDPIAEVATSDPAAWAQNISINLIGAYHVVRAVLPGMLAKGGGFDRQRLIGSRLPPPRGMECPTVPARRGWRCSPRRSRSRPQGRGSASSAFSPGTIDTDMQVKIRASGMNMISRIPRGDLSPVEHAVRGLLHLCSSATTT